MAPKPAKDIFRMLGVEEDVEAILGDPPPLVRRQERGFSTSVGTLRPCRAWRWWGGPPVDAEADPAKNGTRLVGCEVGTVETRHQAEYLLGRVAAAQDDHVVITNGLRVDPVQRGLDGLRIELVGMTGHACSRHRCVLSDLYSLYHT